MIRFIGVAAMLACASMATATDVTEERGVVLLTGNVWADGARESIKGRAMVCNLKNADSFLSLRTGPDSTATEIAKLNGMAIVSLTGETQEKWARTEEIVFEVAQDGNLLPEDNRGTLHITGWVHTDYLCNYMY